METRTNSKEETEELGKELAKELKPGDVVALYGDLGAGKSTFARGVARGLGITKKITSPTFVFIKSYQKGKNKLDHIDLYRGENITDLAALGLDEIFTTDSIVMIEWANNIKDSLPKKRIDVEIEAIDENSRRITITRHK